MRNILKERAVHWLEGCLCVCWAEGSSGDVILNSALVGINGSSRYR